MKNVIEYQGNIWIATYWNIQKLDGDTWVTYNTSHGLPSNIINDFIVDNKDNLWIGTSQ
jgi:ligand-binding sensor domain-containing protein